MSRLLLCDAREPVNDLLEHLAGEEGDYWLKAFNKFLRKENPWEQSKVQVVEAPLQRVGLPPLDNLAIYMALGLEAEYDKAMAGKQMPAEDPNLWDLLMLPEATCNLAMATLKNLGLEVSDWRTDWDAYLNPEYEVPRAKGPYLLGFARSLTGESTDKSANERWKLHQEGVQGYDDPMLREDLILVLGVYLATGKRVLLNIEKRTRTRSRFRNGFVASFYSYPGEVYVHNDYPFYAYPNACVRPVVSRQLEPSGAKV